MKKFLALLVICLSSLSAVAAGWTDGLNVPGHNISFWLKKYGAWIDGREANAFYPSFQNNNNFEALTLYKKSYGYALVWFGTADGDFTYRCEPDGLMLYLTGKRRGYQTESPTFDSYSGWLRIIDIDGSMILTIDNLNTYRYFQVTEVTP